MQQKLPAIQRKADVVSALRKPLADFPAAAILLASLLIPAIATAQQVPTEPSSTHIFPAGGQRGTEVQVRVGGECLPPNTRFRIFGDGLTSPPVLGDRVTGNYVPSPRRKPSEQPVTHPREWQSHITISADAPLGPALWRLSCARGGTGGRPFIIGDLPEFIENEPNSVPGEAELVPMPVTINGQIAGECDLDYFQFPVSLGDVVSVDVAAARLGSALDPVLQILDPVGHRVSVQELRVGADPVLSFRADVSGVYQLLVSSVTLRGGPAFVYRATVSTEPFMRFAFPPGGQAGTTQNISFLSPTGDGNLNTILGPVTFPLATGPSWSRIGHGVNPVQMQTGDLPEAIETTNNDHRDVATELLWRQVMNGQFESASDEDWFRFGCRAGTPLSIECMVPSGWSSALPVISLMNADGRVEFSSSAAPVTSGAIRLLWQPPADGAGWLRVRDLQQGIRGGPEFIYRLTVRDAAADFLLSTKVDVINVLQGARAEIDVAIESIGGFSGPIELIAEGLPEGVTMEGHLIAAGQTSARLAFVAAEDARSCDVSLRIRGKAEAAGAIIERPLRAVHSGHDADGVGLGNTTVDHLQLTVVHKPVFRLYCNEAYQYAHRGTVYPYLMEVERLNGFDQPIHLQAADRQIKDLDGIEIPETTIAPDQTEFMLKLFLPETMHINVQAHSNVYAQGHVSFVDKYGQQQTMLVVSTMRCMIRTLPTVVRLRSQKRELIATPGGTTTCSFVLDRTKNFTGSMEICLVDPIPEVSSEPIVIPAGETGENSAAMKIHVASSIAHLSFVPLRFRAVGIMDDGVQVVSETTTILVPN